MRSGSKDTSRGRERKSTVMASDLERKVKEVPPLLCIYLLTRARHTSEPSSRPPAPVLDNISGPMGARTILSSAGLEFGTLVA